MENEIIYNLIKSNEKDSLRKFLLNKYFSLSKLMFNMKIAQIYFSTNEYKYIRYDKINDLYYKIVLHNFDYFFEKLSENYNENKTFDENMNCLFEDTNFCKSLNIQLL